MCPEQPHPKAGPSSQPTAPLQPPPFPPQEILQLPQPPKNGHSPPNKNSNSAVHIKSPSQDHNL